MKFLYKSQRFSGSFTSHLFDRKSGGFTLLELLIVIAIITLLVSVTFVTYEGYTEKARLANTQRFSQQVRSYLGAYPIGIWHFDEGTGSVAYDESGNNNNINLQGEWVEGIQGSAFRFLGPGWVETNFGKGIGKGVTYAFWFRLPDITGPTGAPDTTGTFFCTEDVSNAHLEDNLGQIDYGNLGCYASWIHSGFNVSDTKWHYFVFSKSTNSKLCLDNKCMSVGDVSGNIPNIKRIVFNGGCGCGYGNFSQGIIIDELHIFSEFAEGLPGN